MTALAKRPVVWPRWTPAEERVLREEYPNYAEMVRRLPCRTIKAIEYRCDLLGLSTRRQPWKTASLQLLQRLAEQGCTITEILAHFPTRTASQVRCKLLRMGWDYRRRERPARTGVDLLDQIRDRAWRKGVALAALDRACASGQYFASGVPHLRFRYIDRALAFLGGEAEVDWRE